MAHETFPSSWPDPAARASVLLPTARGAADRSVLGPPMDDATFTDLGLDAAEARLRARVPASLADVLRRPLLTPEAVAHRQQVVRDLLRPDAHAAAQALIAAMDRVRLLLDRAEAVREPRARELWTLHAGTAYVEIVRATAERLAGLPVRSEALASLAEHLRDVVASLAFTDLDRACASAEAQVAALRVSVLVRGARVTVSEPRGEPDLGALIASTFERFAPSASPGGAGPTAAGTSPGDAADGDDSGIWLDRVQAAVLDRTAVVSPEVFSAVAEAVRHVSAVVPDATLAQVEGELRALLAWDDILAPARRAGLSTCLPEVGPPGGGMEARDVWDVSVALQILPDGQVIANDLVLDGPERVLVVTGPNHGGKTTTARTFGQLHHLASLGLPVPGRRVRLVLADRVLTVFDRAETSDHLGGRLGDELERVHRMFDALGPRSVAVLNEVFSSTALPDAELLGGRVIARLVEAGVPAVYVTFVDGLSRLSEATVSMVGQVDADDPTRRTFRVERRTADGRAYASALARRHGLSPDQLSRRLTP